MRKGHNKTSELDLSVWKNGTSRDDDDRFSVPVNKLSPSEGLTTRSQTCEVLHDVCYGRPSLEVTTDMNIETLLGVSSTAHSSRWKFWSDGCP